MKRYEIEVIHESSGSYLTYTVETDEPDPDFYKSFIDDISIVIVNEEDLTEEEDFDSIEANQLQKGNDMNHEHYWDTPSSKSLVAECACGEQLERVQD